MMLVFAVLSVIIDKSVVRAIPGGPFISVTANVTPFGTSVLAIILGILCLRSKPVVPIAIVTIACMLLAAICMAIVVGDIYTVWTDLRMRGELFG